MGWRSLSSRVKIRPALHADSKTLLLIKRVHTTNAVIGADIRTTARSQARGY
jgi:hypothetical protein